MSTIPIAHFICSLNRIPLLCFLFLGAGRCTSDRRSFVHISRYQSQIPRPERLRVSHSSMEGSGGIVSGLSISSKVGLSSFPLPNESLAFNGNLSVIQVLDHLSTALSTNRLLISLAVLTSLGSRADFEIRGPSCAGCLINWSMPCSFFLNFSVDENVI